MYMTIGKDGPEPATDYSWISSIVDSVTGLASDVSENIAETRQARSGPEVIRDNSTILIFGAAVIGGAILFSKMIRRNNNGK